MPPQIIRERLDFPQRPEPPHRNPLHLRRPAAKPHKKMPLRRRNRKRDRKQIESDRQWQLLKSPHLKSRHTQNNPRRHPSPKQLQPKALPHQAPSYHKNQIGIPVGEGLRTLPSFGLVQSTHAAPLGNASSTSARLFWVPPASLPASYDVKPSTMAVVNRGSSLRKSARSIQRLKKPSAHHFPQVHAE